MPTFVGMTKARKTNGNITYYITLELFVILCIMRLLCERWGVSPPFILAMLINGKRINVYIPNSA
jgi:hypothetical protein